MKYPTLSRRLLVLALCLVLTGCPGSNSDPQENGSGRLAMVGTIELAVVDDPALAQAVEQLRGEWKGQTGSDFQVTRLTLDELAQAGSAPADAILFPSHQLGLLAENQWLVPVPEALRKAERGQWPEIFSLIRTCEAVWGSQVLGVPLGSPVLVCYCRADLLEKLDREPPETWAEYQELVDLLADQDALGDSAPPDDNPWLGTIEPLAPGWAGTVLLARAAPYATHRENYSTLFELNTMKPLVAGPAFVRALEELVEAASPEALEFDPVAARTAFWQGQCGMALSWPSAVEEESIDVPDGIEVVFAELPGSRDVNDFVSGKWEQRGDDEDTHVPLLGVAGRLAAVTGRTEWPEATCQLLLWLSGDEHWDDVCTASPATTLFRPAQSGELQAWVEPAVKPAAAAQYAAVTETTLSRPQRLVALRIPGRTEYLGALDEAVRRALRGEQSPDEALAEAAAAWDKITDRLGRQEQADAYFRSLGLD